MSLSLSGGPQCELYKVVGPIQGTKEDKAELTAVPRTHNQNRNEAQGNGRGGKRDRERKTHTQIDVNSSAEYICLKLIKSGST